MAVKKLPVKQRIFIREYLKDKNATRAYIAAGYEGKGAAQSASALLTNPKIKEAVAKGIARLEVKIEYTAERTLSRIAEIAYTKSYAKHTDILKACELLGRHFKMFTDQLDLGNKDGQPLVCLTMPANGKEAKPEICECHSLAIEACPSKKP